MIAVPLTRNRDTHDQDPRPIWVGGTRFMVQGSVGADVVISHFNSYDEAKAFAEELKTSHKAALAATKPVPKGDAPPNPVKSTTASEKRRKTAFQRRVEAQFQQRLRKLDLEKHPGLRKPPPRPIRQYETGRAIIPHRDAPGLNFMLEKPNMNRPILKLNVNLVYGAAKRFLLNGTSIEAVWPTAVHLWARGRGLPLRQYQHILDEPPTVALLHKWLAEKNQKRGTNIQLHVIDGMLIPENPDVPRKRRDFYSELLARHK